jgi:hypothetical protein
LTAVQPRRLETDLRGVQPISISLAGVAPDEDATGGQDDERTVAAGMASDDLVPRADCGHVGYIEPSPTCMVHYSERWAAELQRLCGHHGITSGTAHGSTGREFKLDFFTGIAQLREIPAVADFPLTVSKEGDIGPVSEAEAEEIGEALSPNWSYDASVCSVPQLTYRRGLHSGNHRYP